MKHTLPFLFIFLLSQFATAQTLNATLAELNFHEDSDPQNFTSFQSGFYFTATDGYYNNFGRELWHSNGTPEENVMVKDIRTGVNSSNPSSLTLVNGTLFFTANDGVHGVELWKSDGTESGTKMVKDIKPNNNSEYDAPRKLISYNGKLYFAATNNIDGYELWISDGTEAGTFMIKNINPIAGRSSDLNDFFVFNNALYFIADDGINGTELWKSDGTEVGTKMFKNINPYSSGLNNGNQFLVVNNYVYFFANNGTNGAELWKSDGTESGTVIVKDIRIGNNSSSYVLKGSQLNNLIIFEANDGNNGIEIWKSDGTEAGTTMIKDINKKSVGSIYNTPNYVKLNNAVYFLADDGINGNEIWKTDGTSDGTTIVKDINNGSASSWLEKLHVDEVNNKLLFFTTTANSTDKTLWASDGTSIGTFELSKIRDNDISGLQQNFVTTNNATIITAEDEIHGNELWITDGTIYGTRFFADLNYSNNGNPSKFTNVNNTLFFRANEKKYGNQLFKSNGTAVGTKLIKDIYNGNNCIDDLSEMKSINGVLFFSAIDGTHGYELWKSDGTENGTVLVKDINPGNSSSMQNYNDTQQFTVINSILYFYANDGVHGFELWRSDGSETGTYMIKDINSGSNYNYSSYPREFVLLNGTIYFIANSTAGSSLWKTNGTEAGTIKIIDLYDMRVLKAVKNKLFIIAETSGTSYGPHDLWASDGTASGTVHLKTFGDNIDSDIQFTSVLNDELYFVAKSPDSYRKAIYKSNGTIDGTKLVFDGASHPTMPDLDIDTILTCGDYMYFLVQTYDGIDKELWRTNGLTTEKIAGPDTADFLNIRDLTCFNSNLLYLAEFFPHKIWLTNNTLAKPLQLDINVLNGQNLEGYNAIEKLATTDTNLYFSARTNNSGKELYITTPNFSTLNIADNSNSNENTSRSIIVYHNRTINSVTIKSLTDSQIMSFELFDITGKKIHSQLNENLLKELKFNTVSIPKGIYLLKTFLSNDNKVSTKLIIN